MDDYETLGSNSTVGQNAIAGALAGMGEHCLMYPIDSIKVYFVSVHTYTHND